MQKTQIIVVTLGGQLSTNRSAQIASTQPGEQIELKIAKRTPGRVRVTVQEGSSSSPSTTGIELPLDERVEFRLGESQRCFLVTDEKFDIQSIDVIVQPSDVPKPIVDQLANISQGITPWGDVTDPNYCPPKKYR